MVETAPRVSIRPKTQDQVQSERLEARRMQEAFGDMEFVQDMETKGFSDPLVRLGYGAQDGEGPGARIIPQRLNAAGIYTKQDDPQVNAFRERAGFEPGDVGDVYTIGDFQGSNTVWSHEIRHRGLSRLREAVGQDIEGFTEEYLSGASQTSKNLARYLFKEGPSEEVLVDFMDHDSPDELGFSLENLTDDTAGMSDDILRSYGELKDAVLLAAEDMNRAEGSPPRTPRWDAQTPEPEAEKGFFRRLFGYAEGGLVSKNAMSDYFLASSGKMTEVEFVGKHKMSTLEFEKQFAEDNNVDISGTEKLSEVNTTPKGVKMDYSKKPKTMAEGGPVEIDPVSGNEIPPGSTPENVRDDIPAMLSEGEYVVPADVLKYFGVNFFEELRMKAKEGMMSMEMDGRTGGEPMSAPTSQMPPEGMAEGGVVGGFDPTAWANPGLGNTGGSPVSDSLMGSSAYQYKEYFGPGGISQMILFANGQPVQAIPEGYSTTPPSAVVPTTPERDRGRSGDRNTTRTATGGTGNSGGGTLGGILGNPLDDLDFSDTASIDTWAADRLAQSTLQRGIGLAGLGGAAGSAAKELRDIAAVSAAARYYADMGDQESSDRLMGMASTAREDLGLIGRFSERFSDGEDIFDNFKASQVATAPKAAPTRAPSEAIKVGSGTKTKSNDNDRSDFRSVTSPQPTSTSAKSRMAKTGTKPTTPKMNKGGLVAKRTTTKKKK